MQTVNNEALDLNLATNGSSTVSAAGPLSAATIGLFTSNLDLQRSTPLATIIAAEANYDGYARQLLTWELPSRSDANLIEVLSSGNFFRPTDAVVPNTVWGAFLLLPGSDSAWMAGIFDDAPKAMTDTHSLIAVTWSWQPANGGWVYTGV